MQRKGVAFFCELILEVEIEPQIEVREGRFGKPEALNRTALRIAGVVQQEFDGDLFLAGNISNTNIYDPQEPATENVVREMFREMLEWSADAGVDFIIGETY